MKIGRWFEVVGDMLYIYDNPYKNKSLSVSIVGKEYFRYYRNNFNLQVTWGNYEEK